MVPNLLEGDHAQLACKFWPQSREGTCTVYRRQGRSLQHAYTFERREEKGKVRGWDKRRREEWKKEPWHLAQLPFSRSFFRDSSRPWFPGLVEIQQVFKRAYARWKSQGIAGIEWAKGWEGIEARWKGWDCLEGSWDEERNELQLKKETESRCSNTESIL